MKTRRLSCLVAFVLSLCLRANPAYATITKIQSASGSTDSSTTNVTVSAITAGSAVIVTVQFCDGSGCNGPVAGLTSTVTATGCSFSQVLDNTGNSNSAFRTYLALNCSSGATTVTSTLTGSFASTPFYHNVLVSEYSNIATSSAVDQSTATYDATGGTTPSIDTSGSTAQANELVYAAIVVADPINAGAGFTELNNEANIEDEYKVVSSTGVQTATWGASNASGNSPKNIVTLKEAGGGGGGGGGGDVSRMRMHQ